MPHFDWSLNLGTLLSLAVILLTFYRFHIANVKRYLTLEFKVDQMWHYFKNRSGDRDWGDAK